MYGHGAWVFAAVVVVACGGSSKNDGSGGGTGGTGPDAGAGTGGTAGQAGAGGVAAKFPCKDPQPVLVNGQDTGLVSCGSSDVVRREAKTCPSSLPRPDACTATQMDCTKDADCSAQAHGYCDFYPGGGGAPSACGCVYGCVDDSECTEGMRCLCGDPVGTCVPADCGTSADCGAGYECVTGVAYCVSPKLHCQGPADECGSSDDCGMGAYCTVGSAGNLVCVPNGCGALGG
jgi:hypothetical protein